MAENTRSLRKRKSINYSEQVVATKQVGQLNKYTLKRQNSPSQLQHHPSISEDLDEIQEDEELQVEEKESPKKQKSKKSKKETKQRNKKKTKKTEEEQNQGVRIAEQRKLQYLFRNICDMDGFITLESLGRSLLKHKIEFKLKDIKEMLKVVLPKQQIEESEDQRSQISSKEDRENPQEVEQWMKDFKLNEEQFKQFYYKVNKK